jgi:hypothetical protein
MKLTDFFSEHLAFNRKRVSAIPRLKGLSTKPSEQYFVMSGNSIFCKLSTK